MKKSNSGTKSGRKVILQSLVESADVCRKMNKNVSAK